MEQIQFIYFQYYTQYYTVHHKENSMYMEIWHRGWWFKLRPQLPVCFGFTIVYSEVPQSEGKYEHELFAYRITSVNIIISFLLVIGSSE